MFHRHVRINLSISTPVPNLGCGQSAPSYGVCLPNTCFPELDVKGNVLVIKVIETTNYPLDMEIEEWDTVVEYLEQGILEPAFTQKTVQLGNAVVSVGRRCPVV
jgi:hypothetical protein